MYHDHECKILGWFLSFPEGPPANRMQIIFKMFKIKASVNFYRNKRLMEKLNRCCNDLKLTSSYEGKPKIKKF